MSPYYARFNNSPEFTTLLPRQPLTPVPYAIFANTANNVSGTISAAQLSGTAGNFLATNIIVTGSITGNGAGLTGLDASQVSRGTIPLAQLPGEVLTNNAPGVVYSVISTNVYFVRIGGDDTNVGMDLARPLATLSNALALANANSPALIDLGVGCFYASSSYVMTNVSIVGKGPQLTKIDVSTAANVNGLVIQGDNVSISELSIGTNNLNTTAWYMPIMYLAGTNVSFFHVVAMGNNDVFHSIDSGTNRGSITIDSCRLESGFDTINFSVTAMNPLDVTLRNTISEIKWNDGFGSNLFGGVHISSSGTWVVENCVFHQTNPEYSLLAPQYCDATIIVCGNVYNSNPIDLNDSQAMLVVKGTIALSEVNNSDYGTVIYDDCFLRAGTNGPVDGSLLTGVSAESAKGIFNSGSPVLRPIATNYYTTIVPQGNTNLLIFNQAGTNLFGAGAGLVFSYSVTAGALTNGGGIGSFIEQLGVLGFTNADFPTVQNPLAQPAEGISLATSDWYDSAFNDWESVTSTWGDLTVTNNSYQYQCGGDTNATVAYIGNGSGLTCLPATGLVFGTTNLYVHISGTNVTFTTTP
jgi:hypothetical protein